MSGVNVSPHFRKELRYVAYFFNEIIYFRFTECVWVKSSLSADAGSVLGGVTLEEEQLIVKHCLLLRARSIRHHNVYKHHACKQKFCT